MLEDHPDLRALASDIPLVQLMELVASLAVADEFAIDRQPARVDLLQVVDAAQERGLARARGSEQAHHLAALHLEVDALQHLEAPKALVHALGQDHGLAHTTPRLPIHRARIVICSARENPRPNRRSMKYWPTYSTLVIARYQIEATINSGIVW